MKLFWSRVKYWKSADRLGPDVPWTHWRLHFNSLMSDLCRTKFRYFGAGADFRPGAYAVVCSKISIGARVVIRPGSMLFADPRTDGAGITIEDNVMLGSGVHIYVGNHRFDRLDIPLIDQGHYPSAGVVLKNGCWIGANCIILPGVVVGENTVVGAGSIVSRSLPRGVLAAGNPARVLKKIGVSSTL